MVHRGGFCAALKKVRFCGILYVTNDSFKCYIKVGEPMGENKTPQELDFERKHEEDMRRIRDLRLMDDDFMSKVFEDKECAEFLLKIILDRDDLTIQEVHGQHDLNNLQGRSVRLDILAVDEANRAYDIEVQRSDRGAGVKRARYNSSLLDANLTQKGDAYNALNETYVIFITEHDVLKKNLPIYHVDRIIRETGEDFGDEAHIIYVNSQIKDESQLGRLMHDFSCKNPNDMCFSVLANRVRYFKEDTKGVATMCRAFEEVREESLREGVLKGAHAKAIESAKRLLTAGKLSYQEIADAMGLSVEEVKALDTKRPA